MNSRLFFVLGMIVAVVAVGVMLASSGGGGAATPPRAYGGLSTGPAATAPATAATSAAPAPPAPAAPADPAPAPAPAAPDPDAAPVPDPAGPKRPPGDAGRATYVVPAGGQSVYDAARAMLGDVDRWRDVYDANIGAIANRDRIPGGTVLFYPDDGTGGIKIPKLGSGIR